MKVNQVELEETFLYVFQAILVYPQHLQFADGIDLRRTDVNLHMGVARALDFFDLERFRHILSVANGEDDGMALLGQRVDHSDAEVAEGGVVRRREPAQQVQDVHIVVIRRGRPACLPFNCSIYVF